MIGWAYTVHVLALWTGRANTLAGVISQVAREISIIFLWQRSGLEGHDVRLERVIHSIIVAQAQRFLLAC
jgi:hypothetical protein